MADKEEALESTPRGADWEVVSLTTSAYAAAPGPDISEFKGDEKGNVVDKDKGETLSTLFMSRHFVVPPSQHENLPFEPQKTEFFGDTGEDDTSEALKEKGGKPYAKKQDDYNIGKLTDSDDSHGTPFFNEKVNDFAESTTLPGLDLAGKEQRIYGSTKFHSFHDETIGESNIDNENKVLDSDIPNLRKHLEEDNYDESGLPYAIWLKKRASSLYAHAKEANTFWSIFIATAVMGFVILGQQWQQERWLVLHHKWQFEISDESMRRMVAPISRFKDALVGGNRRAFSIRGNALRER